MSPRAIGKQEEWWLAPGGEECQFCLATVHSELLYHCPDCDRPVCPLCAVSGAGRRSIKCPECAAA